MTFRTALRIPVALSERWTALPRITILGTTGIAWAALQVSTALLLVITTVAEGLNVKAGTYQLRTLRAARVGFRMTERTWVVLTEVVRKAGDAVARLSAVRRRTIFCRAAQRVIDADSPATLRGVDTGALVVGAAPCGTCAKTAVTTSSTQVLLAAGLDPAQTNTVVANIVWQASIVTSATESRVVDPAAPATADTSLLVHKASTPFAGACIGCQGRRRCGRCRAGIQGR